jgi:four helix bundle protein
MLVAYEVALDLVRALRPVVAQLRQHSADAADQVERAASSVVLNLAEGYRRHGRDPKRFYVIAQGSAAEVLAALELAEAWGWEIQTERARVLLDRELGLLWGLTRRDGAARAEKRKRDAQDNGSALASARPRETPRKVDVDVDVDDELQTVSAS